MWLKSRFLHAFAASKMAQSSLWRHDMNHITCQQAYLILTSKRHLASSSSMAPCIDCGVSAPAGRHQMLFSAFSGSGVFKMGCLAHYLFFLKTGVLQHLMHLVFEQHIVNWSRCRPLARYSPTPLQSADDSEQMHSFRISISFSQNLLLQFYP